MLFGPFAGLAAEERLRARSCPVQSRAYLLAIPNLLVLISVSRQVQDHRYSVAQASIQNDLTLPQS